MVLPSYCAAVLQEHTNSVAIIGARWPDITIECDVLGLTPDQVNRGSGESRADILAMAADAEVILAGPRPKFDAETLTQLRCRGIVRYGVGHDNVDLAAATRRRIAVAVVPDYGTDAVALHAVTLVLSAMRRIGEADQMTKSGMWNFDTLRPLHMPSALSAGVIGFGRIGRKTADHLETLGFGRVLAHDSHVPVDADGIESASLQEVLSGCDVVSLHAPARQDGRPLLGASELALMKPGSILVNTARGSLIDSEALVAALGYGRPALAALDVFESEPPQLDRFDGVLDSLIMTPHMAWYTEESERDLRTKAAMEARRLLRSEPLLNQVTIESESV